MNLYILTLWYKKIFIFNTFRTTLLNLFSHAHIYDIFRIIKKFLLFINILSRQKVFQSYLLGFWRGNFHLPCNIRILMNPPCHPRSFSSSPACQPAFPRACLHAGRLENLPATRGGSSPFSSVHQPVCLLASWPPGSQPDAITMQKAAFRRLFADHDKHAVM